MASASLTIRGLRRLPHAATLIALAVAAVVLVGWWLDLPALTALLPWARPTLPPAAIAFAAGGLGLSAARSSRKAVRLLSVLCAVVMVAVATLAWGAHSVPGGTELESFLYRGAHGPDHLRVPLNTAVSLVLLSISILMVAGGRYSVTRAPQFFAGTALLIAFVALVGYAFGVTGLFHPTRSLGMTPWAVIAIHALALGTIFARTDVGFPALLMDRGAGGRLARRVLPGAVVIPLIVPWVVDQAESRLYMTSEFGASIATVLMVVALVWITTRSARVVQRADRERANVIAREQHEREVAQQALIAAETASSAKSDFLAVMSHELRTPLTAIIGYEELLADEITGSVNAQQAQQLSRIKASAHHLLELIDEILTFSRLEAGRETVRKELVDVNRVVEDSASLVSPLAAEKKLAFAVYPLRPTRMINTDPGKVRQILVNLLSNAVKFTPEGGITVATAAENGELIVRVSDTGPGIPPEYLERIFEPFWQAEQKATRRASGTGLGLTVTRRLARLLGGDVVVSSDANDGSTFTVRLPGILPVSYSDGFSAPVLTGAQPRA